MAVAVSERQDAAARYLLQAGHDTATPRHLSLAVRVGAASMVHVLMNAYVQQHRDEALVAACQAGQLEMSEDIFDHPDPDPVLFLRQILTLYLCVHEPPIWDRDRFLVRGDFVPRAWWHPRLFDVDYYP